MKGTRVSASRASVKDSATNEEITEVTPAAKKNTRGKKAPSASKKTPAAVPEGGEKESADRKPAAKKAPAKKDI